jgi:hypothetical protein
VSEVWQQIADKRVYVPADATFSVGHERDAGGEEIELQLRWNSPSE